MFGVNKSTADEKELHIGIADKPGLTGPPLPKARLALSVRIVKQIPVDSGFLLRILQGVGADSCRRLDPFE